MFFIQKVTTKAACCTDIFRGHGKRMETSSKIKTCYCGESGAL